jgi:hypothetical protein
MHVVDEPMIGEPPLWVLCFSRETRHRWVGWLTPGRYKHVRAYGYIPGMACWQFFDLHLNGLSLAVVRDGPAARAVLSEWMASADLMRIPRLGPMRRPPLILTCVAAVRHLIGLPGGTLRPDALWRDCLRNGGEPFEAHHGKATAVPATAP